MSFKALLAATATAALLLSLPASAARAHHRLFADRIGIRLARGRDLGLQTGGRQAQVNLKIADAQQKQENQIKAIRSFIAQGVDAIFLAPVVVDAAGTRC